MPIRQKATISMDIGHSNLKILQTGTDGRIAKFAVQKMPEGCVDDLNIYSEDALIKALKHAKRKAKISIGNCYLVLSGSAVIIRHFTLPILPEAELYQNILHEISGYLPVDPEKYYVDYKIIGRVEEEGIMMYRVMVTTAHKEVINRYKKVLRSAGFSPKIIDTCENARGKLLRNNHVRNDAFPTDGGICILDFGTIHTRVTVYNDGYYYISNVLKRSSQSITDVISKTTGRDILVAERIKREKDFLNEYQENQELTAAVAYEVDSLLYELTRVLDYYRNRTSNKMNRIYLSGGGSLLPGLREYIEKHINIPVFDASDLIINANVDKNIHGRGFAFLLNAYAATLREEN